MVIEKGLLMRRECEDILRAIGHPILILDVELNVFWANGTAKILFGDTIR